METVYIETMIPDMEAPILREIPVAKASVAADFDSEHQLFAWARTRPAA